MKHPLTVSVIIPCYNHGQYLKEALESIEASTYPYIEVVVVDDGSTDPETLQCIDSYRSYLIKNKAVTFLRQHNQGPAAARNNGIRHSKGEFILLLDADDKIDPTYIEKCVWILTKYPTISIVYPSVQLFGLKTEGRTSQPYNFDHLLHHNFIIVASVFRRKVWEDIQGFDENLSGYEDWDFWIRAGAAGHVGYWLREPLFFYRKLEASRLVSDNKNRRNIVRTIRKKNYKIYRSTKKKNANTTKSWIDCVQKIYIQVLRLASLLPEPMKDKGRKWVKPLFEKMLRRQRANSVFQIQSLEANAIDNYITNQYVYHANFPYIELPNYDDFHNKIDDKKMSILFIVPWLVVGGADKVNLDLITQFTSKGHDVHIFTTINTQHIWHERFKIISPHITHLGNMFAEIDELLDYVIDYIKVKKIQIVQLSNSQLGYQIAGTIKKHCPHVKIIDLLHMEEPYYPFDYFRYSIRFREALDHRVVITPYLKEALIHKYQESEERITVIPNGIFVPGAYENTYYPVKNEQQEYVIGFVGRMEEQKLPFDFVKAANEIHKKYKNVRFVMIGEGSLLTRTKKLADSFQISSYISFLGKRDNAIEIMRNDFHILLMPSLREGLPIVGLEAFSMGIPVVATDVPGWRDLIQHEVTGYLAPVGEYKKMAEYCIDLIVNREKREIISRNSFEHVKKYYSIEVVSEKYLEIYQR